ncbi:MAG: AAA family ATPase [Acidimicrobiales bacterium]
MKLERLQVEEGFLDGLDLRFEPGLNVLIGPRGTGKTSVLELIRFCFGVAGYSDESDREAHDHALSVLGSGRATVTVREGDEEITLTRSASDLAPRASRDLSFLKPLVLSQNEIEQVGLQPAGRLRLIDGFMVGRDRSLVDETAALSLVASLTVEIAGASTELRSIDDQLQALPQVQAALDEAASKQALSDQSLQGLASERARLKELDELLADGGSRADVFGRSIQELGAWAQSVSLVVNQAPDLPPWRSEAGEDQLADVRALVDAASVALASGLHSVQGALDVVRRLESENRERLVTLEDESRQLRRVLDEASAGAGAEARAVSELQTRMARLVGLGELREDRARRLANLQARRSAVLGQLGEIRDQRVTARQQVIDMLNSEFGPTLRFSLSAFGAYEDYAAALTEALRGSGLHYNTLAPRLAAAMAPQELAEIIEAGDLDRICDLGELTPDRGSKVLASLMAFGLQDILSAPIEDNIELSLLDGAEYKASTKLSTGQRCTIVLPIVLRHRDRALVIDQPEDHLDNAFIVDTVVKAIRQRSSGEQMICATHNPNIPVLGEASRIVLLGSDGRRGFVRKVGSLESPEIVQAITSVMEGGIEAFERRAQFYRRLVSGE